MIPVHPLNDTLMAHSRTDLQITQNTPAFYRELVVSSRPRQISSHSPFPSGIVGGVSLWFLSSHIASLDFVVIVCHNWPFLR